MRRSYLDALLQHGDRELFLPGLFAITGYRQEALKVEKLACSPSSYTLARKISVLIDSVTSFSNLPLFIIFYLGLGLSLLATMAEVVVVVAHYTYVDFQLGWPSVILSIWFVGGVVLFSVGVQGIYLAKIFTEVKRRPFTLTRSVVPPREPLHEL
jgi:putative glycosyltransferase